MLDFTPETDPITGQTGTVMGDRRILYGEVAYDDSYPTGGEDASASVWGLQQVDWIIPSTPTDGATFAAYDKANGKLLLFTADGTQAGNASDQSAVSIPVLVIGK